MLKKHPDCKATQKIVHMADLELDPVVMFQKRHYKKLFFIAGFLIPVSLGCLIWGQPLWESILLNFFGRYCLLLNITWTVNSLAHMYGNKPYDSSVLASENAFVSFLGYGEGWHNYHHTFPWDYKTSEYGMRFNLTRDIIEFCERIGWAYNLKEASADMVQKRIMRTGYTGYEAAVCPKSPFHHLAPTQQDEDLGF